ncbi:MAG: RES family NAD+ phosphorylase [Terracidiphilus sp.]
MLQAAFKMRTFWRISNYPDLSGEGSKRASARWHSKGKLIVYLAESPAGAMLERLVHLLDTEGQLPRTYELLRIEASEDTASKDLLPLADVDWKDRLDLTRQIGEAWLDSRETPLARVPSAILPHTWNVLLNPEHPDAKKLEVAEVIKERFDARLFRFGAR